MHRGAQGARGEQAAWGPVARGLHGGIHRESRGSGLAGVGGEGTPGEPWEWAARGDEVHPTVVHPEEGGTYVHYVEKRREKASEKEGREYLPRRQLSRIGLELHICECIKGKPKWANKRKESGESSECGGG